MLNYLTDDIFGIGTGWHEHRFGKHVAAAKVNTFIENISQTIYLNSQPYTASASVGIYIRDEGLRVSYEHCYKAADAAMYQAKNSGKSTWNML